MAAEPVSLVTPDGVRDGDPAALSGLTERRGAAVLAYATWVAAPGEAVAAAAEAFARFRAAVVVAEDPATVDPERTLLRGTRYASALAAPVEVPLRIRLRGAGAAASCALVPELLAARAERELSEPDRTRLVRHLSRCAPCRAAEARFRAGEHAYRDTPDQPPPPEAAREIMRALLAAAPRTATSAPTLRVVGEESDVEAAHVPTSDAAAPGADRLDENLAPTTEFDGLAFATEQRYAERITPVLRPTPEPSADAAAEPTADAAEDRQPTYEFDAIPADAFEASSVPIAPEPSWPRTAARTAAVLIVLAVLAVAALAVSGVVAL
jgi:putative zinc finger protein